MADFSIPYWIIALVIVLIIFISVGVYLKFFYVPPSIKVEPSSNNYFPNVGWGAQVPYDGSECKRYQFPPIQKVVNYKCGTAQYTNEILVAQSPTYDTSILDSPETYGIEVSSYSGCVDVDQINAIYVKQTCDKIFQKTSDNRTSWCFDDEGKYYEYGESQYSYMACTDKGVTTDNKTLFCPGNISGISIGFQYKSFTSVPGIYYNKDGINSKFKSADVCDLSDPRFVFRIIRTTNPSSYPSERYGNPIGLEGQYMAIIYRATGECLVPTQMPPTRSGLGVTLAEPGPDNNNGFVWYYMPSLVFYVNYKNCKGVTSICETECEEGCTTLCSYRYENNGRNCIPCAPGQTGECQNCKKIASPSCCDQDIVATNSVPQIIYIGNAPEVSKRLPENSTTAVYNYISNVDKNYTYTLVVDGNNDVVLGEFTPYGYINKKDGNRCYNCNGNSFNTQLATYQLINVMSLSCTKWVFDGSAPNDSCV